MTIVMHMNCEGLLQLLASGSSYSGKIDQVEDLQSIS